MASEAPQKDCSPELQSIYCSENMMEHLVFYQAELEVVKSRCSRCTESVLIYTLIFLNMINQLNKDVDLLIILICHWSLS